jgi:hypothetical protein
VQPANDGKLFVQVSLYASWWRSDLHPQPASRLAGLLLLSTEPSQGVTFKYIDSKKNYDVGYWAEYLVWEIRTPHHVVTGWHQPKTDPSHADDKKSREEMGVLDISSRDSAFSMKKTFADDRGHEFVALSYKAFVDQFGSVYEAKWAAQAAAKEEARRAAEEAAAKKVEAELERAKGFFTPTESKPK